MRVLVHYPVLRVGGAEMSILRLVRGMADRGWQVELVVTTGGGVLESRVPESVKLIRLRDRPAGGRFLRQRSMWGRFKASGDLLAYGYYRIQEVIRSANLRRHAYDLALVGLHGLSPALALQWAHSRRVAQIIRNDLSRCAAVEKVDRHIERFHQGVDWYLCVSETARLSFIHRYPHLQHKTVLMYNLLDVKGMLQSGKGQPDPYSGGKPGQLSVVTVCRLHDGAKGLFRMQRVHRTLLDEGLSFRWYVVGDGPDRNKLVKRRDELGLREWHVYCGAKQNPFPYYRSADISATLSYYEGLCGAINEAKVMGAPVLATEFSGVREQLIHGENGWIVANDEEAIVTGLRQLIMDRTLRTKLANDWLPEQLVNDERKLDLLEQLARGVGMRDDVVRSHSC